MSLLGERIIFRRDAWVLRRIGGGMAVCDKIWVWCPLPVSSLVTRVHDSSGRIVFKQIRGGQRKPLPGFTVFQVPSAQHSQYIEVVFLQCHVLNPSVAKKYEIETRPGWPLLELQEEEKEKNPSNSVWAVFCLQVLVTASSPADLPMGKEPCFHLLQGTSPRFSHLY